MEEFEFKTENVKRAVAVTLAVWISTIVILAYLIFAKGLIDQDHWGKVLIGLIIELVAIRLTCAQVFKQKNTIKISETTISLEEKSLLKCTFSLSDIIVIRHLREEALKMDNLMIFLQGQKNNIIKLSALQKQADMVDKLMNRILETSHFSKGERVYKNKIWNEYINKQLVESNTVGISKIGNMENNRKRKLAIVGGVFGFIMLIPLFSLIPLLVKSKHYYEIEEDKVFYGNTELPGVDAKNMRTLSYTVLKDSFNIYYKTEKLSWADRATFQFLGRNIYSDKNGLYHETTNMFSENQIVPMEGEYDKATFGQVLNSIFYKDKNNIYAISGANILLGKNPLEKMEVPNLDVSTFEIFDGSISWGHDKNRVYFVTDGIKPCIDIDFNTFQVLSHQVAKDKNHVYYLTYNLKSDNEEKTDNKSYAILSGADAPTFQKVNDREYMDKNTNWTIKKEGETVKRRDDI